MSAHPPGPPQTPSDPGAPPRAATAGAALALVAAALALLGQYLLVVERSGRMAVVAYAGGVAAFLWLMALGQDRAGSRSHPPIRRPWTWGRPAGETIRTALALPGAAVHALRCAAAASPLRAALVFLSLALAVAVAGVLHHRAEADVGYGDVLGLWLLSMGLYVLATGSAGGSWTLVDARAWPRRHGRALVDCAALLALALLLRVTALGEVPLGLQSDEGDIGNIARGMMLRGQPHMFATLASYGTLVHYVLGLVIEGLGGGITALRLPNALAGSLAVPATYLAGRQLFDRRVGLVAACLLAVSHMHIHMSRIALAQAIDSLASALVIFTLMRGLGRGDSRWLALAGVGLGLAQYGYIGGRAIDLVAAALVVWLAVVDPALWRRSLAGLVAAFGGAVVAAAPMIRYAVDRPESYLQRITVMGVVSSGDLANRMVGGGKAAWQVIAEQARDAVLAILANPVVAFYYGRLPVLDLAWGALLVLGLAFAVSRMREPRFAVLVFSVLGAVALLTLSTFAAIAANRVTGVMPVLAILAAFSLTALVDRGLVGLDPPPRLSGLLVTGVLASIAVFNLSYYFLEYQQACAYTDPILRAANLAAETIGAEPPGTEAFLLAGPGAVLRAYGSPFYLTQRQERDLAALPPDTPRPGQPGSTAFVYSVGAASQELAGIVRAARSAIVLAPAERAPELDALAEAVPGGERAKLWRCGEAIFEVYRRPAAR